MLKHEYTTDQRDQEIALNIRTSWSLEKQAISIGDAFPFPLDFGLEEQREKTTGGDHVSSLSYT